VVYSRIWLNIPMDDFQFFYTFLWMIAHVFFFCFQFFDLAEVAIIHKTIFARFGYKIYIKLVKKKKKKKKQNPSIFVATYWNLLQKIWRFGKKFLQNLASLGHFFPMESRL
jgi:hypothetical protein